MRLAHITTIIAVGVLLVGCDAREPIQPIQTRGTESAPLEGRIEMVIKDFRHDPAHLVVRRGTTLVITNYDDAGQSVITDDKKFDSGIIASNETAELVMTELGTYRFSSEPHPNMTGSILVVP